MAKLEYELLPIEFTDKNHAGELDVQGRYLDKDQPFFLGRNNPSNSEWQVSGKWSPEQATAMGRHIASTKVNASVTVREEGIARIVTVIV